MPGWKNPPPTSTSVESSANQGGQETEGPTQNGEAEGPPQNGEGNEQQPGEGVAVAVLDDTAATESSTLEQLLGVLDEDQSGGDQDGPPTDAVASAILNASVSLEKLSEIVGQQERRLSLESSEESSSVKTSGAQNEVVAGGSLPRRDSDVFNRYREPKQHTDEIFLDSEPEVYDVDDVDDHVDLKCVLPHQLLQDNCNIGNKAVQLGEASTEENEVQITFDSTSSSSSSIAIIEQHSGVGQGGQRAPVAPEQRRALTVRGLSMSVTGMAWCDLLARYGTLEKVNCRIWRDVDNPTTGGAVAVQMGYAVFSRHSEAEKARRNLDDMPFFGTNPRYEWAVDQPPPEKARHSPPRSKSGGGSRAAHSRNRDRSSPNGHRSPVGAALIRATTPHPQERGGGGWRRSPSPPPLRPPSWSSNGRGGGGNHLRSCSRPRGDDRGGGWGGGGRRRNRSCDGGGRRRFGSPPPQHPHLSRWAEEERISERQQLEQRERDQRERQQTDGDARRMTACGGHQGRGFVSPPRAPPTRFVVSEPTSCYISGLSPNTDEAELTANLAGYGKVTGCTVFAHQGYAFATFARKEEARCCVDRLNGARGREGQEIRVCIAPPDGGPSMGGGGRPLPMFVRANGIPVVPAPLQYYGVFPPAMGQLAGGRKRRRSHRHRSSRRRRRRYSSSSTSTSSSSSSSASSSGSDRPRRGRGHHRGRRGRGRNSSSSSSTGSQSTSSSSSVVPLGMGRNDRLGGPVGPDGQGYWNRAANPNNNNNSHHPNSQGLQQGQERAHFSGGVGQQQQTLPQEMLSTASNKKAPKKGGHRHGGDGNSGKKKKRRRRYRSSSSSDSSSSGSSDYDRHKRRRGHRHHRKRHHRDKDRKKDKKSSRKKEKKERRTAMKNEGIGGGGELQQAIDLTRGQNYGRSQHMIPNLQPRGPPMVGGLVGGPPPFNPGPGHFQRQQPPPQHHHQQQQQHWNAGGPPPPPPPQQIPMGAGRGPGPTPIAGARTPQQDARLRQALDVIGQRCIRQQQAVLGVDNGLFAGPHQDRDTMMMMDQDHQQQNGGPPPMPIIPIERCGGGGGPSTSSGTDPRFLAAGACGGGGGQR